MVQNTQPPDDFSSKYSFEEDFTGCRVGFEDLFAEVDGSLRIGDKIYIYRPEEDARVFIS